jgi:hypothetical protein
MKALKYLILATAFLALTGISSAVMAEGKAFCEYVDHGEKKKKATGHCDYKIDGDVVMIKLANGDQYTLTRKKDKKHKYKDQKGRDLRREDKKDGTHYYKWDHRNITVWPEGT